MHNTGIRQTPHALWAAEPDISQAVLLVNRSSECFPKGAGDTGGKSDSLACGEVWSTGNTLNKLSSFGSTEP
ncbi:hypothetical protein WJX82_005326 [Trebouxia sp. C0006]